MPHQTPNKSCGRYLWEKNWGEGQCKHVRGWSSEQGPGFIGPNSYGSETPCYCSVSHAFLDQNKKTAWPEQGRNEKCLGVRRATLSYGNSWEERNDCIDLRLQLRVWQMGFASRSWYLKSLEIMALWAPHLCAQARFPHCPAVLLILHLGCLWKLSAEKGNGRSRNWNHLSHILWSHSKEQMFCIGCF